MTLIQQHIRERSTKCLFYGKGYLRRRAMAAFVGTPPLGQEGDRAEQIRQDD